MKKRKFDSRYERLAFIVLRINDINNWRNEAIKHAQTAEQVKQIEARALALREAAERY